MFNYNNYMQPQIPRYGQPYQPYANQAVQPQQPIQPQPVQQYAPQPVSIQGLQGKTVDSIDVVKAMDIPLDGTISYFPLVDGTAIVTKQLQADGTSKTLVYKPSEEKKPEQQVKYVTPEELNKAIKDISVDDDEFEELKEDVRSIKKQVKNLTDNIKK